MRSVLGIDAAWTATRPSGVALAVEEAGGWRLKAVAASYEGFQALAEGKLAENRPAGSLLDVDALLSAAAKLGGHPVDLVAIDMPLARSQIVGRRASDDAVSRAYGQRWASTHTPSIDRPGRISDNLRADFEAAGYPLRTSGRVSHGLVEAYPHPALIEFSKAERRLPYKFSNRRKYWPNDHSAARKANIRREWQSIISLMESETIGIEQHVELPDPGVAPTVAWKACEDMLDAVICAAVGIWVLEGRATPFGDWQSAIWIPQR